MDGRGHASRWLQERWSADPLGVAISNIDAAARTRIFKEY